MRGSTSICILIHTSIELQGVCWMGRVNRVEGSVASKLSDLWGALRHVWAGSNGRSDAEMSDTW